MIFAAVVRRIAATAVLTTFSLAAGSQPIDLSLLREAQDVPPVKSAPLQFNGEGEATITLPLSGSAMFHFDVDDPLARYDINLVSAEGTSLVLEAMTLELNDLGQATARDVLAQRTTSSRDSRPARLIPMVFRPGRIYLGLAALREVTATLTVTREPPDAVLEQLTDRIEEAVDVGNDVAGLWQGNAACVSPARLQTPRPTDITLLHPPGEGASLSLYGAQGRRLALRSGSGELVIRNVQREGMTACIELSGAAAPVVGWRIITEASAYPDASPEPDDQQRTAIPSLLSTNQRLESALDVHDIDRFVLPDDGAQAYVTTVRAASAVEACVFSPDGQNSECYRGRSLELGPMAPASELAIEHRGGDSAAYSLDTSTAAFLPERMVHEPNDRPGNQPLLASNFRVEGVLSPAGDEDVIGFDVGSLPQLWRAVVLGENVRQVEVYNDRGKIAELKRRGNARRFTTPDFYLDPGGAFLRISGNTGTYKLMLKPLGAPRPDAEREPNESLPRRIFPSQAVVGTLPEGDRDRFSFFLDRSATVRLSMQAPAGARYRLDVTTAGRASAPEVNKAQVEGTDWSREVSLPAGEHTLELRASVPSPAEYRLQFNYVNPFTTAIQPATLQLGSLPAVQAFSLFRQTIEVPVLIPEMISAAGATLDAWFAHHGVRASLAQVDQGHALQVEIPADLPAGSLYGFIALRDESGQVQAAAPVNITTSVKALPVGRSLDLPAPKAMIGGINVALSALGARWLPSAGNEIDPETGDYVRGNPARAGNLLAAIDGRLVQGLGAYRHEAFLSRDGQKPLAPILDLPGKQPVALAGVGLNTRMLNSLGPAKFAVDVSTDGATWKEVLVAQHAVWGETAYYPFDAMPVMATQVRLRVLEKQGDEGAPLAISGLEVVAVPGLSGIETINIADRRLGALVSGWRNTRVGIDFQIDRDAQKLRKLDSDGATETDFNLAIGFRNQMRAQVAAIELVYPSQAAEAEYPWAGEAIVSLSPSGPAGPWREIARFALPQQPQAGQTVRHELPEYATGTAIKVDYAMLPQGYFMVPGLIRIIERPEDKTYRSVLGLWGEFAHQRIKLDNLAEPVSTIAGPARFEIAADGSQHVGLVEFTEREETWRIKPEPGDTILRIFVQGSPGFEPGIAASDAQGNAVKPLTVKREAFSEETLYEFPLADTEFLDVTATEDARSTVFLFDQSPSVAGFIPVIRRAIIDFANSMQAGRDAVQFKALGGNWPRDEWFIDPQNLRRALAVYGGGDSSEAEPALLSAAKLLQQREGSKAIVIITDGDAGALGELPHALAMSRARVFVVKVSSGGGGFSDAASSQPLVASWAGQTGGQVNPVLKHADVAEGYARASARQLGAKSYALRALSEYRALAPGYLSVRSSRSREEAAKRGRLIIFDASGSMLKRLESGRRISVARKAVREFIAGLARPDGTVDMGLRVFGGEPGSCETESVRAPSRHQASELADDIEAISPKNNARTPIAAAIAAASNDLASLQGDISVLLVTDGEETCGGDPQQAVAALRASRAGQRIDVVAFALEPEIDRRPFANWAKAGGGIFLEAATGTELAAALEETVHTRFDVLNNGEIIASGTVGGQPVELPPGRYGVVFDGSAERAEVQITTGSQSVLDLSG